MFCLPDDFDPKEFLGRQLEQVSYTVNTVHLSFVDDVSITILGAFEECPVPGVNPVRHSPPVAQSGLMGLVGQKVVSARKAAPGTLTLGFERGGTLSCLNDAQEYEAYIIRVAGREIVV